MAGISTALEKVGSITAASIGNNEVAWTSSSGGGGGGGGSGSDSLLTSSDGSGDNVYIEDDWDDDTLTGRFSTEEGVYLTPNENVTGEALVGRYRPEWDDYSGGGLEQINQRIEYDESNNTQNFESFSVETTLSVGSWATDFRYATLGSGDDAYRFFIISANAGDRADSLHIGANDGAGFNLSYTDGSKVRTSLIAANWAGDTNWHTMRTTRDRSANWELFYDGNSKGTTTDNTMPSTPHHLQPGFTRSGGGSVIHVDDLVVK